jgi:hypothetical protein
VYTPWPCMPHLGLPVENASAGLTGSAAPNQRNTETQKTKRPSQSNSSVLRSSRQAPEPVLGGILDAEVASVRVTRTRRGRATTRRVKPVDVPYGACRRVRRLEVQPRDRAVADVLGPFHSVGRRGAVGDFLRDGDAELPRRAGGAVEVEDWGGGVEEVVVATQVDLGRGERGGRGGWGCRCGGAGGGDGGVERDGREEGEDIRVVGCDAGGVEERGEGADGGGRCRGVGAGVVLRDGLVGEG